MKKKILIYGTGAIGRGYLAPTFNQLGYEIFFVDNNPKITNELKSRNSYKTAFSKHGKYNIIKVKYSDAFFPGEEDKILNSVDFVFSCVGPNNLNEFPKKLKHVKSIISFENEFESVEKIKQLSGNEKCFFGIPDVITSNTACKSLLKIDPLCLISENGTIAIEKGNFIFEKEIPVYNKEDLTKYWNCKFYLHNTAHAAAAFLGKLSNVTYLHEAMQIPQIEWIVSSIMKSIEKAMHINKMADKNFIELYSQKELKRFKDKLLFDPISRVGREPLRKLRKHDRLIRAARILEETKQDTSLICIIIKAAIHDALQNCQKELIEKGISPTEKDILKKISNIENTDPLFKKIIQKNSIKPLILT